MIGRGKSEKGRKTYHVVDAAENPVATLPFADDARVVLCLVTSKILFAREAAAAALSTAGISAEEGLGVSLVVFAKVTTTGEDGL